MGHIFVSYSHKDSEFAHRLADSLQTQGFDVWIDARLDYGSHWPVEIQKQLDTCDAFILIMSPHSYTSEWVQSELQRAKRKIKPIFPLLLEGDEPWLSVESTQYYDVRGGVIPGAKFYSDLSRVVPPSPGQALQLPANEKKVISGSSASQPRKPQGMVVLAIAGVLIVFIAVAIPIAWLGLSKSFEPTSTAEVNPSIPINSSTETATEPPTSTIANTEPTGTKTAEPAASDDFKDTKGVAMRLVPAGNFEMGSDSGDTDEAPAHTVYLDDYYIDQYEVTNSLYKACVNAGVCYPPQDISAYSSSQYADHPVLFVDWNMAKTYCEWRGAKLPSEAQWEKAARGTDGRTYPWGEGIDCSQANYLGCASSTSNVTTHPGGASPYGVYDMAGNVWEWTSDWYSETYYQNSPAENPPGPDSGTQRVLRSGAWNVGAVVVRTSQRNARPPSYFDNDIGFRCIKNTVP